MRGSYETEWEKIAGVDQSGLCDRGRVGDLLGRGEYPGDDRGTGDHADGGGEIACHERRF